MSFEPVNLVHIALAAIAFLGFFLTIGSPRLRALSALMVMALVWMVFNVLEETAGFRSVWLVTPAFRLVYPPLFYLFARGLVFSGASLSWRDWPHFIPFILALFATPWIEWVEAGARISILVYAALTAVMIWRYHRTIRETRSDAEMIALRWLYLVLAVYLVDELFDVARMDMPGLHLVWPWLATSEAYFVSMLFSFVMVCAMIYLAMRQSSLFDGLLPGTLLERGGPSLGPEPETSHSAFDAIDAVVRREALYTEPRMTLAEVAKASGVSEREASQAINRAAGRNFNDYINRLRVEDVCAMIRSGDHSDATLLDLAYTAGFSSKSVFNAHFKRVTGQTPSAWRSKCEGSDQDSARPKS